MAYQVQFDEGALADLRSFPKHLQTTILDAISDHLTHQPDLVSKSRIKRLREYYRPQYRLRVDEIRVFYDIDSESETVMVHAVVAKSQAQQWLINNGLPETP